MDWTQRRGQIKHLLYEHCLNGRIDKQLLIEQFNDLNNVEPVKHGRWITVSDGYGNGVATASICECSLCKDTIWVYKNDKRKWKFCPNCGARMDEVEENG